MAYLNINFTKKIHMIRKRSLCRFAAVIPAVPFLPNALV